MPAQPMSADTPSTAPPYADVLTRNEPPRSATTDMPQIASEEEVADETVDNAQNVADVADTSTETPEVKVEGEPDAGATKTGGEDEVSPQQRAAWTRLRNQAKAAEQAAATLAGKVDQLTEIVAKLTAPPPPKEVPRPTRETFDSPEAYDEALEKWSADRATAAALETAKADQAKAEQTRQAATLEASFQERVDAFEEDHPDYEEVVMKPDLFTNPVMGQAIKEADDGPEIAYYLAQNRAEHDRISKLSPLKVVYEIGKISTKLATPVAPPPKPVPKPISPIRARNTAGEKDPAEMSMAEYTAWRAAGGGKSN
jgi:hypothetical protein